MLICCVSIFLIEIVLFFFPFQLLFFFTFFVVVAHALFFTLLSVSFDINVNFLFLQYYPDDESTLLHAAAADGGSSSQPVSKKKRLQFGNVEVRIMNREPGEGTTSAVLHDCVWVCGCVCLCVGVWVYVCDQLLRRNGLLGNEVRIMNREPVEATHTCLVFGVCARDCA